MGGVGKTSLARAYAQRYRNDYGVIWWVRAEDPGVIDAELRSLLEALGSPGEVAQIHDARTAALTQLGRLDDPWLLVLDNVADAAAVQALLPPAGQGHVMITSQATNWPDPSVVVPVLPLVRGAAIMVLTRLSLDDDATAAEALANELAGLPLALIQAASFVRTNAIDLARYLRWYRERSADLHREGRPADYPHTVATTWRLAIERLTTNARTLLNLLAYYAPDAIPVQLLLASPDVGGIELAEVIQPLLADELARSQAIGELHRYDLAMPAASDTVAVHRLVQSVTRNQLRDDLTSHQWAEAAHTLITAALPKPERRPAAATIAVWNALQPHLLALLAHLPPDHPDTLTTRGRVAYWTWKAGAATRARDLFGELLSDMERLLGAEHRDTLATRASVANLTGWAGDPAQARDLLADLLPVRRRLLGEEHPDTLLNRNALAWWTGEAGDAVRARDLTAELLAVRERLSGVEHIDTLVERYNVAYWTGHAGDAVRARDMFADVVAERVRLLGEDHPITLDARRQQAIWIGQAGDAVRARDSIAALLPVMVRVVGADNTETLWCRHNLAFWVGRSGDPARARDLFAELLPAREQLLGAEHPDTVDTRSELEYWAELTGGPMP
jgi:hypothetical protein